MGSIVLAGDREILVDYVIIPNSKCIIAHPHLTSVQPDHYMPHSLLYVVSLTIDHIIAIRMVSLTLHES